jgi:uncharacterized membrane protein
VLLGQLALASSDGTELTAAQSGVRLGGSSSATACFHRIRMDSYHMKRNGWLI